MLWQLCWSEGSAEVEFLKETLTLSIATNLTRGWAVNHQTNSLFLRKSVLEFRQEYINVN